MKVKIGKSTANGEIYAPPSKSMAHRMLICAGLAGGKSRIKNIDFSEDILATIDCLKALGVDIEKTDGVLEVNGGIKDFTGKRCEFRCRESGSTMRFFMGLAMLHGGKSFFFGSETLRNRPFTLYEKICEDNGIELKKEKSSIYLCGKVKSGEFVLPGNVSSQFITGLLFILPLLSGESVIRLIPPVESAAYIDLTIEALKEFGVRVDKKSEEEYIIPGFQKYMPCEVSVEGDYSNAAFLDIFNELGGNVTTLGLKEDSLQGDRIYKKLFKELSCGYTKIDISSCPDLGPVLMALAAAGKGAGFTGTKRLAIKESNRGLVMCEELLKVGGKTDFK
ncbi:MAG: 3-phosphoshikimate 1-carboxyvinyltransferase [Lachnospiraceae bacterium]|nr:3-phosphoshikimate 1-carboxyvinyltransferase [Lachnospiraceae bacterium]